mgnify:CR=1 FL=1
MKDKTTRSILEDYDIENQNLERALLDHWITKSRADSKSRANKALLDLREKVNDLHYEAKNAYLKADSDYKMQQVYGKLDLIAEIRTLIDEAIDE